MKTLYLWVSDKGWTPFQYNELSELSSEFEARNIKLGGWFELLFVNKEQQKIIKAITKAFMSLDLIMESL